MPKAKRKQPHQSAFDLETQIARAVAPENTGSEAIAAETAKGLVPLVEDDSGHRMLLYATEKGLRVDLRYEGDTFWASQGQMAEMFGVTQQAISEHVRNILRDGELQDTDATHKKFLLVRKEGSREVAREIDHYDLNTLISVGYRVGSKQGTMFRIWATDKLFQILTKGFYVDKERLKNRGEPDVLDEFRQIAREIRTSIRNSYREVLRLCTLCADYDGKSETARAFFMEMESKLLWAAAGMTAPQLVIERCDAGKPDAGLTYYAGKRGPTQRDVVVGNNYLAAGEAQRKNRITEMWLTYVEEQLDQGRLPTMGVVREKLTAFIQFNQWPLLVDKGQHARDTADKHALGQLEIYRQQQND
jgi:hypothetical protein